MSIWPQWFYQYGVGGLFFLGAMILALRTGAIRWNRREERRLFLTIVAAFLSFLTIHAVWIRLASG